MRLGLAGRSGRDPRRGSGERQGGVHELVAGVGGGVEVEDDFGGADVAQAVDVADDLVETAGEGRAVPAGERGTDGGVGAHDEPRRHRHDLRDGHAAGLRDLNWLTNR